MWQAVGRTPSRQVDAFCSFTHLGSCQGPIVGHMLSCRLFPAAAAMLHRAVGANDTGKRRKQRDRPTAAAWP